MSKEEAFLLTGEGIVIAPHEKYVPILVELYQLCQRAGKATPESTQMDLEGPPEEILTGGDQHRFRSALGTLLYISQDRVDIQHCVRNLSQFMASPTRRCRKRTQALDPLPQENRALRHSPAVLEVQEQES